LDLKTALEMIEIFKKLAKSRNKCVIVVTHSKEVADEADCVLLNNQRLNRRLNRRKYV